MTGLQAARVGVTVLICCVMFKTSKWLLNASHSYAEISTNAKKKKSYVGYGQFCLVIVIYLGLIIVEDYRLSGCKGGRGVGWLAIHFLQGRSSTFIEILLV